MIAQRAPSGPRVGVHYSATCCTRRYDNRPEFAALLAAGDTRAMDELDRYDLASLVERQLVALEDWVTGHRLRLTEREDSIVKAVTRQPH